MTDLHHPRTAGEAVHRDNADLFPAAQMVKPLVWEPVPGRGYCARDYAIVDDGEGYDVYFGSESIAFIGHESGGDPLVEAKKIAEKHHHEYILSALQPAAQDGAEVERLRAEQAEARERAVLDSNEANRQTLRRINAENTALKADAARYRWLRSRDLTVIYEGGVFAGRTPQNVALNGEDLDDAVDAALRAHEQGGA